MDRVVLRLIVIGLLYPRLVKCVLLAWLFFLEFIEGLCGTGVTPFEMRTLSAIGASRTGFIVECPFDVGDHAYAQAVVRWLSRGSFGSFSSFAQDVEAAIPLSFFFVSQDFIHIERAELFKIFITSTLRACFQLLAIHLPASILALMVIAGKACPFLLFYPMILTDQGIIMRLIFEAYRLFSISARTSLVEVFMELTTTPLMIP